jgi:hypothetical protein
MMAGTDVRVRRRSATLRIASILFAAVQMLTPGVAAWADGLLEAEARANPAISHVESKTTPHCPRVHADDCALCQYLATASGRPSAAASFTALGALVRPVASLAVRVPRRATVTLPPSRAPPTLV